MKPINQSISKTKTPSVVLSHEFFDWEKASFIDVNLIDKNMYFSVQTKGYPYSFYIGIDYPSIKNQLKTQGIKIDDANLKQTEKYLNKSFKHLQKGFVCEDVFKLILKYFHDIVVIELRKTISKKQ
jgi:hypothetical protein